MSKYAPIVLGGGELQNLQSGDNLNDNSLLPDSLQFLEQSVTPATPTAGKIRIYAKTDHQFYQVDSNGVETLLTGAGSGTTTCPTTINFKYTSKPGIKLSSVLTIKFNIVAGFSVNTNNQTLKTKQISSIKVITVNTGTLNKPILKGGIKSLNSTNGTLKPNSIEGIKVTQISYTLTHTRGAKSAVNNGPQNWTNPGNAADGTAGVHNGTNATIAGQALAATDATLQLSYPTQNNRSSLTITNVTLNFYVAQSGTVANNGNLILSYSTDGSSFTTLETITGDVSSLTTPRSFTISTTSWTDIQNLITRARFNVGLGTALVNASVDAIEVVVTANHTQIQ